MPELGALDKNQLVRKPRQTGQQHLRVDPETTAPPPVPLLPMWSLEWLFTEIHLLIVSAAKACSSIRMMRRTIEIYHTETATIPGVFSNWKARFRSSVAKVLLHHGLLAQPGWHFLHRRWLMHSAILHLGC